MTHDVSQLAYFITGTLLASVPLLLTVAGALVLMFRIDMLAGRDWSACWCPCSICCSRSWAAACNRSPSELQAADAMAVAIADENLGMLPAIKTFTREAAGVRPLSAQDRRNQGAEHQPATPVYAALEPAVQFVAAAAVVLLLWLASGAHRQWPDDPGANWSVFCCMPPC